MFQRLIFCNALAAGATIGIRVIAVELFERRTFRADVLVVLGVLFEGDAVPCAVCPTRFVQYRNMGIDVAVNEPFRVALPHRGCGCPAAVGAFGQLIGQGHRNWVDAHLAIRSPVLQHPGGGVGDDQTRAKRVKMVLPRVGAEIGNVALYGWLRLRAR